MEKQPRLSPAVAPFHNSSRRPLNCLPVCISSSPMVRVYTADPSPQVPQQLAHLPSLLRATLPPSVPAGLLFQTPHWRLLSRLQELPMERASSNYLATIAPTSPTRSASASMSIHFQQVQTLLKSTFSTVTALDIPILPPGSIPCSLGSVSPTLPADSTLLVLCPF